MYRYVHNYFNGEPNTFKKKYYKCKNVFYYIFHNISNGF